jgi:hypothetical protein
MKLLDLCSGRWGWSRVFAARGWECEGIDLTEPPDTPARCLFRKFDILGMTAEGVRRGRFDFAVASTPCEGFSVFGMPHFHPNPSYPELGIRLFNHVRAIFEEAKVPYVMENVRTAQRFVGHAVNHCGPFFLWGNAVPPLLPHGIKKGFQTGGVIIQKLKGIDRKALTDYRRQNDGSWSSSKSAKRKEWTAQVATIPPELANCVCDYAERLLEQKATS